MTITLLSIAMRFVGLKEVAGAASDPLIKAMLALDNATANFGDEVPWCSAFLNWICWILRLPRSKSLAARSWLAVGFPVALVDAEPGWDIVILSRGAGKQPGPEVLNAPGHVGVFAGFEHGSRTSGRVLLVGGNQGDQVQMLPFDRARVLGVRRLIEEVA